MEKILRNENATPSNKSFWGQAQNQARLVLEMVAKYRDIYEQLYGSKDTIGAKKLWESWQNEVRTSYWIAFCVSNVVLGIIEYGVSWPIWQDTLPDYPWLGALGMLLVGALISHGFAKVFSDELDRWQFCESMRARLEDSLDDVRKSHKKDKLQDAIISSVILIFASYFVYELTALRVAIEERAWMVIDWAPVGLFVLNSTLIGIYWQWFFRRRSLLTKIKRLEGQLKHLESTINHHLDLFEINFKKAEEVDADFRKIQPKAVLDVLNLIQNRDWSDVQIPEFMNNWSAIFVFESADGSELDQPFVVRFSNGFESQILHTGSGYQKLSFPVAATEILTEIEFLKLRHKVTGYLEKDKTHYVQVSPIERVSAQPLVA